MVGEDCPELEQLRRHLLGLTDGSTAESLDLHFSGCDHCLSQAYQIEQSDPLIESIRFSAFETPLHFDSQHLEQLLQLQGPQGNDTIAEVAPGDTSIVRQRQSELVTESSENQNNENHDDDLSFLLPAVEPDEIGRLGRYRILNVIGIGGMGIVFRAHDPTLNRLVALKAMRQVVQSSNLARSRFQREAQAVASIAHDNIVEVYEVGEDQSVPFIAMQFLRGESLRTRMDQDNRFSDDEVVRIGHGISSGLAAAHRNGLIHRDIKPDNIWIEAETNRVKILDFGLVRPDDAVGTQTGMVLGTPKYMSPEQSLAQELDARSDLFSLGSVLYEMVTGVAAFGDQGATATLMKVAKADVKHISQIVPEANSSLAELIMQLLEKSPDERIETAQQVSEVLSPEFLSDALLNGSGNKSWVSWKTTVTIVTLVLIVAVVSRFNPWKNRSHRESHGAVSSPLSTNEKSAENEPPEATHTINSPTNNPALELLKQQSDKQYGQLIANTIQTWEQVLDNNKLLKQNLKFGIRQNDSQQVLTIFANLMTQNAEFQSLIESAQSEGVGSLIATASSSGTGHVDGVAVDLETLIHFSDHSAFIANRTLMTSFQIEGVLVQATASPDYDICIGFEVNTPEKIQGPLVFGSIHVEAEKVVLAFDPDNAMRLKQFIGAARFNTTEGNCFTRITARFDSYSLDQFIESRLLYEEDFRGRMMYYKGDLFIVSSDAAINRRRADIKTDQTLEQLVFPAGKARTTAMLVANGGIYTAFDSDAGAEVTFSPDGLHLGGGGESEVVYQGDLTVTGLVSMPGRGFDGQDVILTVFDHGNGGITRSPNGKSLGGGGTTSVALPPGKHPISTIAASKNGVYTAFEFGSSKRVTFSEDGLNLENSQIVYQGPDRATHIAIAPGRGLDGNDLVLTAFDFGLGGIYRSSDGKNLGGGENTELSYPIELYPISDLISLNDGFCAAFVFDNRKSSVYFSSDGSNMGGGIGKTVRVYDGPGIVRQVLVEQHPERNRQDSIVIVF